MLNRHLVVRIVIDQPKFVVEFCANQMLVLSAQPKSQKVCTCLVTSYGTGPDASFFLSLAQFPGINRAVQCHSAISFPDVLVGIRILALELVLLFRQRRLMEPGVVAPVDLDHNGIGRRICDKTLISLICCQFWVECQPDFRALPAVSWGSILPRMISIPFGLLRPRRDQHPRRI